MITLFEQFVAEIEREVEVVVDIETTNHAEERRDRDENHGLHVDDDWLVKVVRKASPQIINHMLFHKRNDGTKIGIKEKDTNLNLVCRIATLEDKLKIIIITMMIETDFRWSPDIHQVFYI